MQIIYALIVLLLSNVITYFVSDSIGYGHGYDKGHGELVTFQTKQTALTAAAKEKADKDHEDLKLAALNLEHDNEILQQTIDANSVTNRQLGERLEWLRKHPSRSGQCTVSDTAGGAKPTAQPTAFIGLPVGSETVIRELGDSGADIYRYAKICYEWKLAVEAKFGEVK